MSRHTYADRARHFRAQAIQARAGGHLGDARRLDALAHRCETTHRQQPVALDDVVAVAAQIERNLYRALTINESSAVKSAYHAALSGDGTIGALIAELSAQGWAIDTDSTRAWAAA